MLKIIPASAAPRVGQYRLLVGWLIASWLVPVALLHAAATMFGDAPRKPKAKVSVIQSAQPLAPRQCTAETPWGCA